MRWWVIGAVGVLLMAVAGGWAVLDGGGDSPERDRLAGADIAAGERLYQENCASCHGADREGQPNWRTRKADGKLPAPPLDGSAHTWHHPDGQLLAIIAQGVEALGPEGYKSDMKGFGDRLSASEIRDILAFIKAQWPADIRERQAEITARADNGGGDN